MLDWNQLPVVLGFVSLLVALYMAITLSAGIYASARQFWRVLLVSAGVSYLLSGSLFLFLHVNSAAAVVASAIVPFLVGNFDFADKEGVAQIAAEDDEAAEQEEADGAAGESAGQKMAAGGEAEAKDEEAVEVAYSDLADSWGDALKAPRTIWESERDSFSNN